MQEETPYQDIEEDYNEEEDSDFDGAASDAGSQLSSEDEDNSANSDLTKTKQGDTSPRKKGQPLIEELDSGDEVTIKERQKSKKKQRRRKAENVSSDEEGEGQSWRAKTRSMRVQEQEERQKKSLASLKASSIDVEKLWEELNKPGPLPPVRIEGESNGNVENGEGEKDAAQKPDSIPTEEMITIKRQFKFAGEVHFEEKIVPKSSAEAQLWLSQQDQAPKLSDSGAEKTQRPLRKISRFDPNYSNHEAFRNLAIKAQPGAFKGPKLNVVEKSKMDWASHVDAEGLQNELSVHAKAKDAYLNRMDFLNQVAQRKEEEARLARQKG